MLKKFIFDIQRFNYYNAMLNSTYHNWNYSAGYFTGGGLNNGVYSPGNGYLKVTATKTINGNKYFIFALSHYSNFDSPSSKGTLYTWTMWLGLADIVGNDGSSSSPKDYHEPGICNRLYYDKYTDGNLTSHWENGESASTISSIDVMLTRTNTDLTNILKSGSSIETGYTFNFAKAPSKKTGSFNGYTSAGNAQTYYYKVEFSHQDNKWNVVNYV